MVLLSIENQLLNIEPKFFLKMTYKTQFNYILKWTGQYRHLVTVAEEVIITGGVALELTKVAVICRDFWGGF